MRFVKCVRLFAAKDKLTQLNCRPDDVFIVLREVRKGWIYVKRKGKDEEGEIPEFCVKDINC